MKSTRRNWFIRDLRETRHERRRLTELTDTEWILGSYAELVFFQRLQMIDNEF